MGHAQATFTGASLVLGVPAVPATQIQCRQGQQVARLGVLHNVPLFFLTQTHLVWHSEKRSAFSRRNTCTLSHFSLKRGALLEYPLFCHP